VISYQLARWEGAEPWATVVDFVMRRDASILAANYPDLSMQNQILSILQDAGAQNESV